MTKEEKLEAAEQRITTLEQELERCTNAWFVGEAICPDGSLRATVKGIIDRAEVAGQRIVQLEDALIELKNMTKGIPASGWSDDYRELAGRIHTLNRELLHIGRSRLQLRRKELRHPVEEAMYELTFAGFLAVRLMRFRYGGKEYRYTGRKLENAVRRLTAPGGPRNLTTAELVIWGQADYDWRRREGFRDVE